MVDMDYQDKSNLTYEEYLDALYNYCMEHHAVCQAYPEDFEIEFNRQKESGYIKKRYDKGDSVAGFAYYLALMV